MRGLWLLLINFFVAFIVVRMNLFGVGFRISVHRKIFFNGSFEKLRIQNKRTYDIITRH